MATRKVFRAAVRAGVVHFCAVTQTAESVHFIEDVDGELVPRVRQRRSRVERDGCAVPTAKLAELLGPILDKVERTIAVASPGSSQDPGRSRRRLAAVWLSQQTARYDPAGIGVPARSIERIMEERGRERGDRLTQLRVADVIVTAVGIPPHVFYNGTLPVQVNSAASSSARECCRRASSHFLTGA